jgi:hypothetical protein
VTVLGSIGTLSLGPVLEDRQVSGGLQVWGPAQQGVALGPPPEPAAHLAVVHQELEGGGPLVLGAGQHPILAMADHLTKRLRGAGHRGGGAEGGLQPLDGALGVVEAAFGLEGREADVEVPQEAGKFLPLLEGNRPHPRPEALERRRRTHQTDQPQVDVRTALQQPLHGGLNVAPVVVVGVCPAQVSHSKGAGRPGTGHGGVRQPGQRHAHAVGEALGGETDHLLGVAAQRLRAAMKTSHASMVVR